MAIETKVGFATVSELERQLREYILIHTNQQGKYIGRVEYLTKYSELCDYLSEKNKK
jgi:hypothetical protein